MPISIGIRPMGTPRRMGAAYGLYAQQAGSGDADNVRRLFARALVAGRDGTLAQSGATGATALHPTTGAVVTAGSLISHNLPIPGVGVLPMNFAQGARQNLCVRSQEFDNASWVKTTVGGGSLPSVSADSAIAPDGSTTADVVTFAAPVSGDQSVLTSAAMAVTASSTYTGSVWFKAATPSDVGKVLLVRHVAASGYTAVTLTSSWVRFSSQEVAFGASRNLEINLRPALGASTGTVNAAIWGAQVELGSFPGLYIPTTTTALTRAADNILWTPPSALSTTSGEVVAVAAPYLWSAGAGAAHPGASAIGSKVYQLSKMHLYRSTSDFATFIDTVSQNASASALAESNAAIGMMSGKYDGLAVTLYRGASQAAQDTTLSPPWSQVTAVNLGAAGSTNQYHGFVGAIYVPGGLTDAERTALARLTAGSLTYVG